MTRARGRSVSQQPADDEAYTNKGCIFLLLTAKIAHCDRQTVWIYKYRI